MTENQARDGMDKRLRALLASGVAPDDAAAQVVAGASREELESMVSSWALNHARWMSRKMVLDAERSVERAGGSVARAVASGDPRVRGIKVYVDGEFVAWDRMTAAQHDARAAMQRRLAGDCIKDAERHEDAARMIREARVTCLADIGTANEQPKPIPPARSRAPRRKRQAVAA